MQTVIEGIQSLRHRRLLELLLYVIVSIGIIATFLAMLLAGMSWTVFVKYTGLVLITSLVFGNFISSRRASWPKKRFWIFAASALILHAAIWLPILIRSGQWKFLWFYPGILELPVLAYGGDRFLRHSRRHR